MPTVRTLAPVLLAGALACAGGARASDASEARLLRMVQRLDARVSQLEQRNAELEKQLAATRAASTAPLERRIGALEAEQTRIAQSLDTDTISENEPELTARVKAVEDDALAMRKAASRIDALDGLAIDASLTTVAQTAQGLPTGTLDGGGQLNYRADIGITVPLEAIGNAEQKLYAQFRLGQGQGLNAAFTRLGAFASAPDAAAFRASGLNADDSAAILGQAWYQASIPLPVGGFKPNSRQSLELTLGKMDLFGFFDQNAVAGDESSQFLNSVFVHNPLLDAGGEVGTDANGFQPGAIVSYLNQTHSAEPWRLSLGLFGTGRGADYSRFFTAPLLMVQAERELRLGELAGHYRIYGWSTGQGLQLDGTPARHNGWGISIDQRINATDALFARYGQVTKGQLPFRRALTIGAEFGGARWNRSDDAFGIAAAWLPASGAYRAAGGSGCTFGDGSGDGLCDPGDPGFFAFLPAGAERVVEAYYRFRVAGQVHLSPDIQHIWNMGGNPGAKDVTVFGLRAQVHY